MVKAVDSSCGHVDRKTLESPMTDISAKFKSDHFDKVMYLCGLIEQLGTMTHVLYTEKEKLEDQKKNAKTITEHPTHNSVVMSVPWINTTLEVALKSSILFFQFSVLEAIVGVLSDLTIQINNKVHFEPKVLLTQAEVDFITETSTFYDPQKNETIQRPAFKRLEDKIVQVPFLFAKMMGTEFKLPKDDGHWEKFKDLKKNRDGLTHPKPERLRVHDKQIFDGSAVIYWLTENYFTLIQKTLYENETVPYKHLECSTMRLVATSYHATLKQYNMDLYLAKHQLVFPEQQQS